MLGDVEAGHLVLGRHAVDVQRLECTEENEGAEHDPDDHDDRRDDLRGQELTGVAGHEDARVRLHDAERRVVLLDGEDAHHEGAKEAVRAVHRKGVERVVDAKSAHEARGEVVREGGEEANDDGRPRVDDRTARGHAHQTSEQ